MNATTTTEPGVETAQVEPRNILAQAIRAAMAITEQPRAEKATNSHGMAAETLAKICGTDSTTVLANLEKNAGVIKRGSLREVEATLASQATVLNAIFNSLVQSAFRESITMDQYSTELKLALRAQAQSADALEKLASIKQGPTKVILARQLNAANQQVVNNGSTGGTETVPRVRRARKPQPQTLQEPSPLRTYAKMDGTSQGEATPEHSPLEPVDEIHRTADARRQEAGRTEPLQRKDPGANERTQAPPPGSAERTPEQ